MHSSFAIVGMLGGWEVIVILGFLLLMAAGVVLFILTVLTVLKGFQRSSKDTHAAGAETANARSMSNTTVTLAVCPRCGSTLPANAPQGLCPRCVLGVGIGTQDATPPAFRDEHGKPNPPDPAVLAKHFPQLEIMELLGHGGMGAVYKARQTDLDRVIALKVLPGGERGDPTFTERFSREARALARLNHPNIVAVHDFGQVDGFYYFIMEYIDGPNLRELMQREKLSPREAMTIVPKICEALQFAHDEGIVHRDIKPENILMDQKGRVKIADFGIAKIVEEGGDATLTGARDVIGTPHYMAPEQVEKPNTVDHRADIYSLGVVFYEMLTGELPLGKFETPSRKVQLDVRLDDVVLHALEKEPQRRYQRASEVKTDVETISSGEETPGLGATRRSASEVHEVIRGMGLIAAQWTARILGTMLLVFYGFFLVAEGLPPIAAQSVGVQLNFIALGLMLGGFAVGWKREGTAAVLIASGWTLWHVSEGRIDLNLFQTPLPVAVLYGYCWWELRGRRTGVVLGTIIALAVALGLGRLFLPVNVFVHGTITDATTGAPITNATLTIVQKRSLDRESSELPNARTGADGGFRLHLGWYTARQQVGIVAPGYTTLTTNLGPRELGQRRVDRNFRLSTTESQQAKATGVPRFGPICEALLSTSQGRSAVLLDLDSNQRATNTVFGENDRETHAWVRSQNMDVLGVVEKGQVALLCFDMAVIPVGRNLWAEATPEQVLTNWNLAQQEPKPVVGISTITEHSDTFFFRTRENGQGVLQIMGRSDEPLGVGIRYRLVQESDSLEVSDSPTTPTALQVPPVVVHTVPQSGARDVDPSLAELAVTFSKPMRDGNWSWVKLDDRTFPKMTGSPRFSDDGRTCILPVQLEPGRTYATWINVDAFQDFRDIDDIPSVPYLLIFKTKDKP